MLVPADTADGRYYPDFAVAAKSKRAELKLFPEPGNYEIRYLRLGQEPIARHKLEVRAQ